MEYAQLLKRKRLDHTEMWVRMRQESYFFFFFDETRGILPQFITRRFILDTRWTVDHTNLLNCKRSSSEYPYITANYYHVADHLANNWIVIKRQLLFCFSDVLLLHVELRHRSLIHQHITIKRIYKMKLICENLIV